MSITETPQIEQPKKPRKARRKRKSAAPPKQPSELAGITIADCPRACTADRCVISGRPVCAHPRKGGLQPAHMNDEMNTRLDRAKKILGKKPVALKLP